MSERHRLLEHTNRVTIETTNVCPWSPFHRKCPAHHQKGIEILPRRVVYDVVSTLADWNMAGHGGMAWHAYNEPLADCRLTEFISFASAQLPGCYQYVWTSGWSLDENMMRDLMDSGVTRMWCSAYTDDEYNRMDAMFRANGSKIAGHYVTKWRRRRLRIHLGRVTELDDRLEGTGYRDAPCYVPLMDLTIWSDGRLGFCCMDWQRTVTFGSLLEKPFAEVLESAFPEMVRLKQLLTHKRRDPKVCQTCGKKRHKV